MCIGYAAAALFFLPAAAAAPATEMRQSASDYGVPVRIVIPRIDVNAPVVALGVDKNGYMETPSNGQELGWYKPGVMPGQRGNAVIDGHYDTATQSAIFFALRTVQKGDVLFVMTQNGLVLSFTVYDIARFDAYHFPIQTVFGASTDRNLNLITCEGEYDSLRHTYLERLVVFTRRT